MRVLSPICPHLGCSIPWNKAKQEFICPCHVRCLPGRPKSRDQLRARWMIWRARSRMVFEGSLSILPPAHSDQGSFVLTRRSTMADAQKPVHPYANRGSACIIGWIVELASDRFCTKHWMNRSPAGRDGPMCSVLSYSFSLSRRRSREYSCHFTTFPLLIARTQPSLTSSRK